MFAGVVNEQNTEHRCVVYVQNKKNMLKYRCEKCETNLNIRKATMIIVDGKIQTKEAKCKCGKYMNEIEEEIKGWPTIIRNERNGK